MLPTFASEKVVRIGVVSDAPFAYANEHYAIAGFLPDLHAEISQGVNQSTQLIMFESRSALIKAYQEGQIQGALVIDPQLNEFPKASRSKELLAMPVYLLSRPNNNEITDLSNYKNKNLGLLADSALSEQLLDEHQRPESWKTYTSPAELVNALAASKVDAIVLNQASVAAQLRKIGWHQLVKVRELSQKSQLVYLLNQNQAPLKLAMNEAIEQLERSIVSALQLKWGVETSDNDWSITSITLPLSIAFLFLIVFGILTNRKLKAEIKKREAFEQQLAVLNVKAQSERQQAQKEARTDPLTGIDNRRKFDEYLNSQIQLFNRKGNVFCLMIIDIDHFKLINDEFGHDVGDTVLKDVSHSISEIIRPYDELGRIGGEEFGVILPDTERLEAFGIAERILDHVVDYKNANYPELAVSVSIGLSEVGENDSTDAIFKRADDALYQSKENGRNRVTENHQSYSGTAA
ncbi:GGDEF domain-containing protein [Pleionea litopenaei]|uniref:diguanylate cyclase n=1 Tax=Pleionea litopenaei TaxID=3070815 RepID=A0AA51RRT3_9GAMM|nr:GGDEF domain-containing protein [Pleionea sp. HL-JVS1]WMS86353.1 GGDEF domain-containing protein [Pleionea sp. HL-JVS1]